MDRIVLRPPAAEEDPLSAPLTSWIAIQCIALFVAVLNFHFLNLNNNNGDHSFLPLPYYSKAWQGLAIASLQEQERRGAEFFFLSYNHNFIKTAIILGIILVICHRLLFRRRRLFLEAAVEISPIGVQLVSIFGTMPQHLHHDNSNSKNNDNDDNHQYKVRAFLPRQKILDVIVMEVVWPHCVWSQVAFRVVVEGGGGIGNDSSPTKTPPSTQQLLKQNRVAIVPAFSEECQGMLTYEQCLHIQAEIEKLLVGL